MTLPETRSPPERQQLLTSCRICEPYCGLVATVEKGRLVSVRGDPEHALSAGYFCKKAAAMIEVNYDPDRVLTPLKRMGGPGEFEPVGWDEALQDIACRLQAIRLANGHDAFATFLGNPPAFAYATAFSFGGFKDTLKTRWNYGVNADDAAATQATNAILYGSAAMLLKPDFWRSDFALIIGANPLVSHGSTFAEPRIRDALRSIVKRGGRVVVVDPRRSETARRFEHVGLKAGTDPYFLLGLLNVIVSEQLFDATFVNNNTNGFADFSRLIEAYSPEWAERGCGIPARKIVDLARSLAIANSAVVYGRTGTCTQLFGTLSNLLQNILNIVTGNLDRPGGLLFGWGPVNYAKFAEATGLSSYGRNPSRTTGQPDVGGLLPSMALVSDILTPGAGQVRALMTLGANPVLNSPAAGLEMETALADLELHFSLDLYINETNKFAHYILPVTSMYEHDNIPMVSMGNMLRPALWAWPAVIEKRGDVREDWQILDEICARMGFGGAYSSPVLRLLARIGVRIKPRLLADLMIRTSAVGDWFGLRPTGLSLRKLHRKHPHGVRLKETLPAGVIEKHLQTGDGRINLTPDELHSELARLDTQVDDPTYPLRLHGQREVLSQNSWMHNAPSLTPDRRQFAALISPLDADRIGLRDGQAIEIASAHGSITVPARITDDMTPGNIALPHGWGHSGGWQRANQTQGVCSNALAGGRPEFAEAVVGMSVFNGIPVTIASSSGVKAAGSSAPRGDS